MRIKNIFIKIILGLAFFVVLIGIVHGVFFVFKIISTEKKISVKEENKSSFFSTLKNIASPNEIKLKGIDDGRINILLLGIAGAGMPGNNLTDTIIVASLNAENGKVALLSIPRDLYVEVPETGYQNKINTIYEYGIRSYGQDPEKSIAPIESVIKNITSLDINYWAVLNFNGFQKAVDSIGGINIMNERDIYDSRYPGPNYSYEVFELKKGLQHLDGVTALKYARMRHNDPEGDFGRAKRQQQVMKAVKNKIFSTGTLLNALAINQLLNSLGENVKTNITGSEFEDFIKLIKKLDTNNINNVVLDAWNSESLLKVSHVFYENSRAFVLIPRIGNWNEVEDLAQNIFNTNEIKRKREEISKENANIVLINKSGNSLVLNRIKSLLKDNFNYKNVVILSDQAQNLEKETFVYDLTSGNKSFTLNELIKKLPAHNATDLNANYRLLINNVQADLVIVIGKDIVPKYNMEINTIEEYNKAVDTNDYTEFRN